MRSTLIGLVLGCGLLAAAVAPAAACQFYATTASDQQTPAQTAQAQPVPPAADTTTQ